MKSQYLRDVLATVEKRNPGEPEFIQAVTEVLESLEPVIEVRPDLVEAGGAGAPGGAGAADHLPGALD